MGRYLFLFAVSILSLSFVACVGSSTGNPAGNDDPSAKPDDVAPDDVAPIGVELLMSDVPRKTEPEIGAQASETLGSGNRAFAFDLYQVLAEGDQNLF
jgi:hypothetical protein